MTYSSVAFAVPEVFLRKIFTKAFTFAIYLDSSKNFRPCKRLVGKY